MPELKLAKLPDRTPVKIGISVNPDIYAALTAYAEAYQAAYGSAETVAELIPYMLEAFVDSDSAFRKAQRDRDADPNGEIRQAKGRRNATPVDATEPAVPKALN